MPFPETNREIYRTNPLAEVAVQLRFPTILRIDAESPAQFQDRIRTEYPFYQQVLAAGQLPSDVPPQVRNFIQGMGAAAGPVRHLFETQDRKWSVALSREDLMLRTMAYTRWEDFRDRLTMLRGAFEQIYRPASYARLGMRYVDIIRRSILGLTDVPWSELLKPYVAGELSTAELGDNIESMSTQLHCNLDGDNYFLTLRTGIALAEPINNVREKCFLIDSDFHTHKPTETANVATILDTFNRYSGSLFRWAIQPRLRQALGPQPL